MAILLPDSFATFLNLVGIPWPNIDEDELRHCAGDLRDFASSLTDSVKDTSGAVSDTSGQTDAAFAKAFAAQWEGRPGEITVISDGADVLAVALEVIAGAVEAAKDAVLIALGALAGTLGAELIFTGGLADLLAGGIEVEIAQRAVKAALDVLEQQVAGQLINSAIHPLTDRIPATVRKFLAGSAEAMPVAVALKADCTQLGMAATKLDTHAHRTDTTGATLQRRSSSRNFAKDDDMDYFVFEPEVAGDGVPSREAIMVLPSAITCRTSSTVASPTNATRSESWENLDNLPAPDVIAREIVEDLTAVLAEFEAVATALEATAPPKCPQPQA